MCVHKRMIVRARPSVVRHPCYWVVTFVRFFLVDIVAVVLKRGTEAASGSAATKMERTGPCHGVPRVVRMLTLPYTALNVVVIMYV